MNILISREIIFLIARTKKVVSVEPFIDRGIPLLMLLNDGVKTTYPGSMFHSNSGPAFQPR